MAETESLPTYEEFKQAVEREYFKIKDDDAARKYIKSQEAEDTIKEEYAHHSKEFKAGKVNRTVFMNGCVNSVSYCLYLMTE